MTLAMLGSGQLHTCTRGATPPTTQQGAAMDRAEKAIDQALHMLSSEHYDEVEQAMAQLLSDPDRAHAPLLDMLEGRGDGNPHAAAELLGKMGRPSSVDPLISATQRGAASLRYATTMALAEHSHPTAFTGLGRLLEDPNKEVRASAAVGLAARGDKKACDFLVPRPAEADRTTRYHMVRALMSLGCLDTEQARKRAEVESDPEIKKLYVAEPGAPSPDAP